MTPDELKARTKKFGLRIIQLCEALPRSATAQVIRNQLLRSGTSVGANYSAACRSRSSSEFVARMGVVEEETDESAYWIELVSDARLMPMKRLSPLLNEANELCRIVSRSPITAKSRSR